MDHLNEKEENIKLLQLISEYAGIVIEFQDWFHKKQLEIHSDSIKEFERLQEEYCILCEKAGIMIWTSTGASVE